MISILCILLHTGCPPSWWGRERESAQWEGQREKVGENLEQAPCSVQSPSRAHSHSPEIMT